MKYKRWALAFAMVCGLGHISQALAESLTLPDTDTSNMGGQTKSCIFPPSQAGNMADSQGINTCLDGASSPEGALMTVTWDSTGKLLTITIASPNAFPAECNSLLDDNEYTGNGSNTKGWNYLDGASPAGTMETAKDAPGDDLRQVINQMDTEEEAMYTENLEDVLATGLTIDNFMLYDLSMSFTFTSLGGAPPWANISDRYDVMRAEERDNGREVKKPEITTVVLVGMGTIATMVLFGMGIAAGLAGRKK